MHNFPQELFDYVVDFVHDDLQTLATVRLVCHAWNIAARAHLFCSLDLLISKSPGPGATCHASGAHFHVTKAKYQGLEKFKALLSLLESSPDISQCVRQVSFGRTTSFSSTDPESLKQQSSYAVLISSILSRFGLLSSVVFREMNWSNLGPSFSSCILEICKTRTLQRVELWNCQMPTASALLDFLGASKNVGSLRISYFKILTFDIDVEVTKPTPSTTAREHLATERPNTKPCTSLLHSLAIDSAPDTFLLHKIFGMRPCSIDFRNLRRLYLGNVSDKVGVVKFLQTAGHSLEFLDIRLMPGDQTQPTLSSMQLALSHCPRLQHFRISGLHWTPALCPSEYLSSLFAIPPDQSLPIECLQLVVTVLKPKVMGVNCSHDPESPSRPLLCRPTELRYSDWNVVDTILSSPIFHVLRRFQISVKSIREREVDLVRLSDMFPLLKNKGVQVICT